MRYRKPLAETSISDRGRLAKGLGKNFIKYFKGQNRPDTKRPHFNPPRCGYTIGAMGALFWYQAAVALTALVLVETALVNFWSFRKPRALVAQTGAAEMPLISILVPARDE